MMTFMFWNVKKNSVQNTIADLAEIHEVDVIILAECDMEETVLLRELNSRTDFQYSSPARRGRKTELYTRFPPEWITHLGDIGGMSVQHLENPIVSATLLLVAVHLPSRRNQTDAGLSQLASRWRSAVEEAEKKVGHKKTVVVGDFNMDPFHSGVISSEGFHGTMDKRIANRKTRRVLDEDRHFFYNPMWSLFGDETAGPPGTYFYDASSEPENYYWHMYDQVLLRPELIPYFPDRELRILTHSGSDSLTTNSGRPDAVNKSDHLPLLFRLDFPVT